MGVAVSKELLFSTSSMAAWARSGIKARSDTAAINATVMQVDLNFMIDVLGDMTSPFFDLLCVRTAV